MGIIGSLINGAFSSINTAVSAKATRKENEKDRQWNAQQAELNRMYQTGEREAAQEYNTSEREAVQAFNSEEAAKNRDWQTSEREAVQDWNLEQWNRENEYNSPEAQMDRMTAAGINPNAAIQQITGAAPGTVRSSAGGGSQAAGSTPGHSSGQSGSVASSNVNPGAIGELISGSVNSLWQNLYTQQQIEASRKDNMMRDKELGVFDERFNLNAAEIQARIDEMNKNVQDKDADIKLKSQQFEFLKDMNPVQLETAKMMYTKTAAEINQIDQQIENLKKQYELTDEQIKNIQADTSKKEAETDFIGAQQELTESQKALVDLQGLYQQKQNLVKDLEVGAAEQGISFSAPDFWNLYNYQQRTGQNPVNTLMKPTMKIERRRSWRNTGQKLIEATGQGLINAGTSWISNPLGMSGAFGSRSLDNMNPKKLSKGNNNYTTEWTLPDYFNR